MLYDAVIIGAGLSGLTAASLLAKRDLKVCVIDAQFKPGGSCGIFKRNDVIFEQGSAMIYGFGEAGFSPHRFVFNALEEPIDIIKHDELYAINFNGHRIIFYEDIDKFIEELEVVFPGEKENFSKFYKDMSDMYLKIIAETPTFYTPDSLKKEVGAKQFLSHPLYYIKFLSYMNTTAENLLKKYFKKKEVFDFFDKLTSTYCYTTVKETPAVLAAVMFVDNHFGGSYYPAGSTIHLVGKLEKVIEENEGDMIFNKEVVEILTENNRAIGVKLDDGSIIKSKYVINSGTVWNLYNKLIKNHSKEDKIKWANSLKPTYPSVVLFACVKSQVIPNDALPIEMLVDNTEKIDEGELTAYILSKDDNTLCKEGYHTVTVIGPSFKDWDRGFKNDYHTKKYFEEKEIEKNRILDVLEKRFPGFKENIIHVELSTPSTIERYTLKDKGVVAGPKQELGQHMLKRLRIKSEIDRLYNCGESTTMGTGTPTVTISGISAANLILRELGLEEFEYSDNMKNYVNIVNKPFKEDDIKIGKNKKENNIAKMAMKCQFCDNAVCQKSCPESIQSRDINRRIAAGNFYGAQKLLSQHVMDNCINCKNPICEKVCIRNNFGKNVEIKMINSYVIENYKK